MKKYFFFFLFLIAIISITLYSICSADTFYLFTECLNDISFNYIILLFSIIFLYFLFQGIYMKTILGSLKTKISILKGMFYSIVEFYFSGITPSSTGGQPIQIYFMTKDKIPGSNTTITVILNTIFFKLILIILGIFVLVFNSSYVFSYSWLYTFLIILGFSFDCFMIIFCFSLLFNENSIRKGANGILNFCKKIRFLYKRIEKIDINSKIDMYKSQINYIKYHKGRVLFAFAITFMQRLLLFSVSYVIYRGMGFNSVSYFDLLAIQVCVQLAIELFPLPGGTALSEKMFLDMFVSVFGLGIAEVGMIFTRLFTFYIPLLISCIIIISYIIIKKIVYSKR